MRLARRKRTASERMRDRRPRHRAAYVRALIAHRCPELTDADLVLVAGSDDTLPVEIAAEVLDVIDLIEDRLTELEDAVTLNGPSGRSAS